MTIEIADEAADDRDRKRARKRRWEIPWEDDEECRAIVAEHPDGMTLEEIAAHMGLTRERLRQIEGTAIRKARIAAARMGFEFDGALELLLSLPTGSHGARSKTRMTSREKADRVRAKRAAGEWAR